MYALSALVVLTLASVLAYGLPSARIVGGGTAYEGQFPYQAAVSYQNYACCLCGASILNERYVLATAECIVGYQAKDIKVMYGSINIFDPNRTRIEADKLIPHRSYKNGDLNFDIGLIKLKENIVFGPKVKAIKLPTNNNFDSTYPAVVSGWGILNASWAIYPSHLQFITLNVIPQTECIAKHNHITKRVICASADSGSGVCDGDEGGPLVADGVQVGILSFTPSCNSGYPNVFTRVYHFLDWINDNTKY